MGEDKISIIEEYAKENGIIYGIGSAEPFDWIEKEIDVFVPFVNKSPWKRTNPQLVLEGARSIICIGLSYNIGYGGEFDERIRGNISAGAVGEDYHRVISRHMSELCAKLGAEGIYFSDTGPLNDRAVAEICGLGKRGRHFSVINQDIGSMFFIGYIITRLNLERTAPRDFEPCGSCRKCIDACPGGALSEDGFVYKKCLSYLTQAKTLSFEDCTLMGRQIYGCDVCQKVCPHNSDTVLFTDRLNEFHPDIEQLLSLSPREFRERFGKSAAGWRGRKIIRRNAVIALSNIHDSRCIDILKKYANDPSGEIRWFAEMALKRKA